MRIGIIMKQFQHLAVWRHRQWMGHGLFWFLLLIILIISDFEEIGFPIVVYQKLIDVSFYAIIIYINLLYLIPKYLSKKRFLVYSTLLLLFVALLTPIKIAIPVLIFTDSPGLQGYHLQQQGFYFLSMFLIGSASTLYSIVSDWFIHQSERKELETQKMQSELKFLRSQINPHFLFNTLNNLYALTLKKSNDAPEIVLKLSEMMRYMLYECNERRVPLAKEIAYMKNYLDLEKLRQHNAVDIHLDIRGNIVDQKIAPLLLVPFIENSFKHGLNSQIDHGYVNLFVNVDDNHLSFVIENSKGPAKLKQVHPKSGGIGLVNVRRRLNLIYPDQYHLKIKNKPNSFTVSLELEL